MVSDQLPTPFRPAAIMKARTNSDYTPSDDVEDNHWHREKECPCENQLDNDPVSLLPGVN